MENEGIRDFIFEWSKRSDGVEYVIDLKGLEVVCVRFESPVNGETLTDLMIKAGKLDFVLEEVCIENEYILVYLSREVESEDEEDEEDE